MAQKATLLVRSPPENFGEPRGEHAQRGTLDGIRARRITTRGRYTKADDAQLLPLIQQITAKRPTYGYRRIAAVLNRQIRAEGADPVKSRRLVCNYEQLTAVAETLITVAASATMLRCWA